MSEPARLYFHAPSSATPPVLVACSHSPWDYQPGLWRLLLADAAPSDVPDGEHGVAVASSATAALARLAGFRRLVDSHPLLHRIPALPVYLRSVDTFLRQQVARFSRRERAGLLLIAQREDAEGLDQSVYDELAELWETLSDVADNASYWQLDEALYFARGRMDFTQWRAWAERFGLASLVHPYFSRLGISAYDESDPAPPDAVPFEDHGDKPGLWGTLKRMFGGSGNSTMRGDACAEHAGDDADDEDSEDSDQDERDLDEGADSADPWFGTAFRPVHVDGKVGLRFVLDESVFFHVDCDPDAYVDPDPHALALAAEWDEIAPAGHLHAWGRRGGKWALIALRRHCSPLTDLCVDEVVQEPDSWATHVVVDGLCGLICLETGRWLTRPTYDEMVWSDRHPDQVWRVRRGAKWGLLSVDGVLVHDCVFDSLPSYHEEDYRYDGCGFHVRRAGRAGWVGADGSCEIACDFDEVRPCDATGLFAVRRGALWGLVAKGDRVWLPPIYLSVEPLMLASHLGACDLHWSSIGEDWWPEGTRVDELAAAGDTAHANVLIAVSGSTGMGVVDQANRVVVPLRYASVTAAENGSYRDARWLCLTGADGRVGLWSVEAGAETFPCEHRCLDMFVAPRIARPLIGIADGRQYRLLYPDGSPAYTDAFLSISDSQWLPGEAFEDGVGDWQRSNITQAWLEGRAVRAMLADGRQTMVSLFPGRALASLAETLEGAYLEGGDRAAALSLAQDYLTSGAHEQARLWAARACGHAAHPGGSAHADGRDEEEDSEHDEHNERDGPYGARAFAEEAATLFADVLDRGIGGPRDAPLALHWARRAGAAQPGGTRPETLLLLGKLLLDPQAGPVDRQAAVDVLVQIHHPNLEEGMAALLIARCVLDEAPADLGLARAWLVRADGAGAEGAALELAALLERQGGRASGEEASLLRREAAYYRKKAAAAAGR